MKDNNDLLIIGAAVLGYMYMKKQSSAGYGYAPPPVYQGGVASMPASVGTGNNQVQTGALLGFLQAVSGSLSTRAPVVPTQEPFAYGAVQDNVPYTGGFDVGTVVDNILY